MKTLRLGLIIVGCVLCFAGCQDAGSSQQDNWLLVSFEKDVPVTYRMISERATEIDLTTGNPEKKSRPQTTKEKLELVMVYTPVEVDPFGLSTLEVQCLSVKATRSAFSGKKNTADTMETLTGKSFILKLTPTGEIADISDLERVAKELGAASFSKGKQNMRIKNPDMINDFLAMQRYLWAASSTISNQLDLAVGDTWQAQQSIPWPVPIYPPPARTTTYTLENIQSEEGLPRKATLNSVYTLSETPIEEYIRPYEEGKFQMRGLFGFLRNFQFKHMEGTGTQIFNMDDGLVESDTQQYRLDVTANFMLPLGDSLPVLTVDQKILIERIETP
ncbi:MAG: DUF6263 family protein [Planctomycetota bacterium]